MPVQCTKNVSKALRLANGTIGNVVHIQSDPGSQSGEYTDSTNGLTTHTHSKQPQIVYIKLVNRKTKTFVSHLPSGVVPV